MSSKEVVRANCPWSAKCTCRFPTRSCAKTNHVHLGQRRFGLSMRCQAYLFRHMKKIELRTDAGSTCVTQLGIWLVEHLRILKNAFRTELWSVASLSLQTKREPLLNMKKNISRVKKNFKPS